MRTSVRCAPCAWATLLALCCPIGYQGVSHAAPADRPHPALVSEVAADIARIETALQRHRLSSGPLAAVEVNANTLGVVRRAERTLQLAALLQSRWNVTVDSAMLQREFERMRRETVRPAWLTELVEALDRDEVRVARALVAPVLTARLALERFRAEGNAIDAWESFLGSELPASSAATSLARSWRVSLFAADERAPLVGGNDSAVPSWRSGGLLVDARDGAGAWTGSAYLLWNGDAIWIYKRIVISSVVS